MKKRSFLLLPLALAACGAGEPNPGNPSSVHVAAAGNVSRCNYLGDVTGISGNSHGSVSSSYQRQAEDDAKSKAAAMGGDTVVWENGVSGQVTAHALDCRHPKPYIPR